MTLQVINPYQWLAESICDYFAVRQTHQQRAHKARSMGYTYRINVSESQSCTLEGFTHDGNDSSEVLARG